MADIRLRVGAATATLTFNATDAQVAATLRRFARNVGVSVEGTNQEQLTAILEYIRDDVRSRSITVQVADAREANEATIRTQAEADNVL